MRTMQLRLTGTWVVDKMQIIKEIYVIIGKNSWK
jgi:hypothetical protein